jgi:hypothetical protein
MLVNPSMESSSPTSYHHHHHHHHPQIFNFLKILKGIQADTYIKIRSDRSGIGSRKNTEIPNETELYKENVQGIFRRMHFHLPVC